MRRSRFTEERIRQWSPRRTLGPLGLPAATAPGSADRIRPYHWKAGVLGYQDAVRGCDWYDNRIRFEECKT